MRSLIAPVARLGTKWLNRMGITVIPTWKLPNRGLALHLSELFTLYSVDCVIDVGAHQGQDARFLRDEAGFTGTILSFEPVAGLAAKCQALAAADPKWHVFPFAAGDQDTESEINVMAVSQFSSFLAPTADSTKMFSDLNKVDHTETVHVRRLDGLLPDLRREHGFVRPYLKIDTQGFDLAVIRGAGTMLETIVALQTELSFLPIYKDAPSWKDVMALLTGNGFSVSNMFTMNLEGNMRAVELDCVFLNDRFATAR